MHPSQATKVTLILIHSQSTLSPDEDQQYSDRNVAIHIKVTKSLEKRLTELSSVLLMTYLSSGMALGRSS